MAKETIDVLIEGGKATAAPPLGPALGPMGVNIGEVVGQINAKTKDFAGMKVPVRVIIDKDTKEFEIKIGTPPASALIKSEAKIKKGAANALTDKVADLKIEQILKIAKMKSDSLLGKDDIQKCREIVGTCQSMGIMIEGMSAQEFLQEMKKGKYDQKILSGKTELTAEELKEQEEEKKRLQEEMEARREEFEAKAKEILASMAGKDRNEIKKAMVEAEIPGPIIEENLPEEEKKEAEAKPEEKKE